MCTIKRTEQVGGDLKKRTTSVVVAKTLDLRAQEVITSLEIFAKGNLLRMVCRTSISDVVQIFFEATKELVCKKSWDLHKNEFQSQRHLCSGIIIIKKQLSHLG